MTRENIEAIVTEWVPRLGLSHWELKVDWSRPAGDDNDAEFERAEWYDVASLFFSPKYVYWARNYAERVVLHELMHLVTRDLDGTVDRARSLLPSAARRLAEKEYERAIEGVVERM